MVRKSNAFELILTVTANLLSAFNAWVVINTKVGIEINPDNAAVTLTHRQSLSWVKQLIYIPKYRSLI